MERRKRRNPSHAKALPGFEKGDDRVDDGFVINYYPIVTLICHSSPTAVSQKRRPPGAAPLNVKRINMAELNHREFSSQRMEITVSFTMFTTSMPNAAPSNRMSI